MQFTFCEVWAIAESGETDSALRFRDVVSIETPTVSESKTEVERTFRQLVADHPDLEPLVVLMRRGIEGTIVASEHYHSTPERICERQGRPYRELIWTATEF